jgi:hypothetical protein
MRRAPGSVPGISWPSPATSRRPATRTPRPETRPGWANKAAVDRLNEQAQALEAAIGQGDGAPVQPREDGIERIPTQPPRNQGSIGKRRGATGCPVTPRQDLVELRGLEPLTPRLPALCSPN